jgi:hypothetical protein
VKLAQEQGSVAECILAMRRARRGARGRIVARLGRATGRADEQLGVGGTPCGTAVARGAGLGRSGALRVGGREG